MNVHDKEWTPPWGGYSQQRHVPLPAPIHPPQQLQQHRSPATMAPVSPAPQPPSDNYMTYYYPSSPHYYGHPSDPRTATAASPLRRSDSSPIQRPFHSGSSMSSQPTTPKPSSSAPSSPLTLPPPPLSQQQPSPPSDQSSTPDNNNRTPSTKRARQTSAVYSVNEPSPKFGATKYNGNLFAVDRTTLLDVRIQSRFDRGFFIADNDWTCYRRNYFQVNGTFSIQGFPMYYQSHDDPGYGCLVRTDDDQLHPVHGFTMGISARVADEDKQINLIQHTPKRDKGPQSSPSPKPVRPGGDLNVMSVTDQSVVTFERIQFKSATANNGKRRAAQQYYVLLVELMARLESGHLVKIASNRSAPLVVRGRSPGHYADRRGGREDAEVLPSPSREQPSSASASASAPASASSQPPPLPPPTSTSGAHTVSAPPLPSNDYYYNHAPPSTTQQRTSTYQNGHHPHVPMMATPPAVQSPLDGPVVMRGPHDRSISAPGSVEVYPHDMNRYGNGAGGYYHHHHHNPRDNSPWGSVHTRMASSGESYHMPSNSWYYQYNDNRHHHASSAATNDHHGMAGSPGVMHPYQQSLPTPSTANSPYRALPSTSFPSNDYHNDSGSTSYVREETKAADGTIRSGYRPQHGDEVGVKHRELMEQHGRE